jgi:hypothetical protein
MPSGRKVEGRCRDEMDAGTKLEFAEMPRSKNNSFKSQK